MLDYLDKVLQNIQIKYIVRDVLWAIANITAGTRKQVEAILKHHILEFVIGLMDDQDYYVRKEANYIIQNIVTTGVFEYCATLINRGVMKKIVELLQRESDETLLEIGLVATKALLDSAKVLRNIEGKDRVVKSVFNDCNGIEALEILQKHKSDKVFNLCKGILVEHYPVEEETVSIDGVHFN